MSFTFLNAGVALPAIPPAPNPCPPPPALPLNCDITAIGQAQTISGDMFSPWQFLSVFQISGAFAITGTFLFDDPSAANNDFFGTITGIFDPTTFSSMIDSIVTGGTGMFANATDWGKEVYRSSPPTKVRRPMTHAGSSVFPSHPLQHCYSALRWLSGRCVAVTRRRHTCGGRTSPL